MRKNSDGLIGMWVHTLDAYGDIEHQLEVVSRTGDAYICRIYSWTNGLPCGLKAFPRNTLLKGKLYSNVYDLAEGRAKHDEQKQQRKIQGAERQQQHVQHVH